MNKSPTVSVIIPAYNQAKYLGDALNSVLNQTFEDWECIIVNDGSTDNTEEIANKYVGADKRFKYIYQNNKGLSATRNTGIKNSSGEYIQFLDADDLILPEKLQLQVDFLENNPKFGITCSGSRSFKSSNKNKYSPPFRRLPGTTLDRLISEEIIPVHSFLLRKECIKSVGLFDENLGCYEDRDFWTRIAGEGFKFYFMDRILSLYRLHNTNMTHNKIRQARGKVIFIKKVKKYINSREIKTNLSISKLEAEACYHLAYILLKKGFKKEGFSKLMKSYVMFLHANPASLPKRIIRLFLYYFKTINREVHD